jgi:hypothetical protein
MYRVQSLGMHLQSILPPWVHLMRNTSLRDVTSSQTSPVHSPQLLPGENHSDKVAQNLVIGTTLCGDWAGLASILQETCPALVGDLTWQVS